MSESLFDIMAFTEVIGVVGTEWVKVGLASGGPITAEMAFEVGASASAGSTPLVLSSSGGNTLASYTCSHVNCAKHGPFYWDAFSGSYGWMWTLDSRKGMPIGASDSDSNQVWMWFVKMPGATCGDKDGAGSGTAPVNDTDCGTGFVYDSSKNAARCAGATCDASGVDQGTCCVAQATCGDMDGPSGGKTCRGVIDNDLCVTLLALALEPGSTEFCSTG